MNAIILRTRVRQGGMNGVVLARTSTDVIDLTRTSTDVIDLARPWMNLADPS